MTQPGSISSGMPSDESSVMRRLIDLERHVRELGPSVAASFNTTAGTLRALVEELQEQVDNLLAVEVNTGNVNASGHVNAAGDVLASGNVRGVDVFTINGPTGANNFTGGRVAAWLQTSDGKVGNTASSRRFKTNIADSGIDPLAVLRIGVKHYNFIAEIRKRDDAAYEHYVGPEYHVALEVGAIAEDLHDAGLWEFVVYERNDDNTLRLDETGKPVPNSIHYELWSLAVLVATQHVWEEHLKVRADTDRILAHLGLDN